MPQKLVGKKAAKRSSRKVAGFTVVAALKNPARRRLMEARDLLTSGGARTVNRPTARR